MEGSAEQVPRLQYGNVGSLQGICKPPIFAQISLVLQSRQDAPVVVQGVHCGNQGAAETHGGIQGLAPAAGQPAPAPAPGHPPKPG